MTSIYRICNFVERVEACIIVKNGCKIDKSSTDGWQLIGVVAQKQVGQCFTEMVCKKGVIIFFLKQLKRLVLD